MLIRYVLNIGANILKNVEIGWAAVKYEEYTPSQVPPRGTPYARDKRPNLPRGGYCRTCARCVILGHGRAAH